MAEPADSSGMVGWVEVGWGEDNPGEDLGASAGTGVCRLASEVGWANSNPAAGVWDSNRAVLTAWLGPDSRWIDSGIGLRSVGEAGGRFWAG